MTVQWIGNVFETRDKKDWRAVMLRVMVARSRIRGLGAPCGCRGMDEGHHREGSTSALLSTTKQSPPLGHYSLLVAASGAVSIQVVSECLQTTLLRFGYQLPVNALSTILLGHPQDHVVASQHSTL
eukprot:1975404-Amphidinium_carterae.1